MLYISGAAYGRKGHHDLAITDFNKALEINPENALAYANRGLDQEIKGNLDHAISDYNKSLQLAPLHAGTYNNRGILYIKLGNKQEGCSDIRRACELEFKWCNTYLLAKSNKHCD